MSRRRECDFIFFVTHVYGRKMACSVSQPSSCRLKSDDIRMMVSGPLEAAQRMKGKPGSFQKRVADDSRGETATCISLNLVVLKFKIFPGRTSLSDPCRHETWSDYSKASLHLEHSQSCFSKNFR